MGIGNHDAGFNSGYPGDMSEHSDAEPIFKIFFPQHFTGGATSGTGSPAVQDRRTYSSHVIADRVILLGLDAGYNVPFGPDQAEWMD